VDPSEFFAVGDQHAPDQVEDPQAHPALEGPMYGAIVPELLGQLVPLDARAQAKDDPIDRFPQVDALATFRLGGVVLFQDDPNRLPQFIRNPPDRGQHFGPLGCSLWSRHRNPPFAFLT
jgi:hypothetical protein